MSAIQPGDVVVCVACAGPGNGGTPPATGHPKIKRNGIYRVEAALYYLGKPGLIIEGRHSSHPTRGYAARAFRKIRPADEQFIHQIRALKPAREDA